jgi:EAL domain-containing protein (putative c-di-GMP-specific phosphodiesterase class I)/ActR/RegA family two-component response regulator
MQVSDLNFLVVEDDEFQRHWLKVMLKNLGASRIVQARDGKEALAILRNTDTPIDIGFIDLNLPGMDGMELIRHLAKEKHVPSIVLASALPRSLIFSVETMSKAYGVNMLGSIEKPVTPDTLLRLIQLYKPASAGPDNTAFPPHFTYEEIRQGLEKDQFEPFFQPKVELATGQVKGVEAFARWRHLKYGILPPSSFLPVLEDAERVELLDWAILRKAVDAYRQWETEGMQLAVSINVSAASYANSEFIEKLIRHVHDNEISTQNILLEVTESAVVKKQPALLENLARLRMHGFGVAIDEYGTVHSSIQDLLRIPFSELKIDRSMIVNPSYSPTQEIALGLTVDLCKKLNCNATASGIEARQEWELLLKLGCNAAQGYYIAHPMEKEALSDWMKEWAEFF